MQDHELRGLTRINDSLNISLKFSGEGPAEDDNMILPLDLVEEDLEVLDTLSNRDASNLKNLDNTNSDCNKQPKSKIDKEKEMLDALSSKELEGGWHGRRTRAGEDEKIVQAKYHLKSKLKNALAAAAAKKGLSTSNYLNKCLEENPEITNELK